MRWEDERYVRLYTRDTPDWVAMGWQARAVFHEILRKVDRAGVLPWEKSRERGLAALLRMPIEVVKEGLPELYADGCVVDSGDTLLIPNFLEAQECTKSDAARKREQRERDRDLANASDVTKRDIESRDVTLESQNVTESHEKSQAVTSGHEVSLLTVPNLTVPNQDKQTSAKADSSPPERPSGIRSVAKRAATTRVDSADVGAVFAYWAERRKVAIPNARVVVMDSKREAKIRARLAQGYTVDDLKKAIDGMLGSAWNVERGFTDIELCCRDASHCDRYIAGPRDGPPVNGGRILQQAPASGPAWKLGEVIG